eukprot:6183351-Pleurochrysis_carterae.AAC.3
MHEHIAACFHGANRTMSVARFSVHAGPFAVSLLPARSASQYKAQVARLAAVAWAHAVPTETQYRLRRPTAEGVDGG